MPRVCVYAGSNFGARPAYRAAAESLARAIVGRGMGIVYGGSDIGLMGAVADAGLAAGGEVIGVMPQALVDHEIAHRGLTELRITASMHERKATMADLADGFVALPGGVGTLEELVEIVTWAQLGLHAKPCGLLDVAGYYAQLQAFLDHAAAEAFIRPQHRALLLVEDDPDALLDAFESWRAPTVEKWIDRASS
ncbi:MAG TPA: TIGR00730 family Rossman fold protein [Acidimicrobiia bacterium]|nr:TIGR00730 family Rossman fold protein [Acidimicrobiia bacterium]